MTVRESLINVYPACRAVLGSVAWSRLLAACSPLSGTGAFPDFLERQELPGLPPYLADLARLEQARAEAAEEANRISRDVETLIINPSVRIVECSWTGLASLPASPDAPDAEIPAPGLERILVWFAPEHKRVLSRPASNEDLLVLKLIMEGLEPDAVAAQGRLPVGAIDAAIHRAVLNGILHSPPSLIQRDTAVFRPAEQTDKTFISSPSFTLQWHITQACDLHCKHCYDRTDRRPLTLAKAIAVLDDLRSFVKQKRVQGAVSFTGGNPLLHPHFLDIYRAAIERNFGVAILGNPAPRKRIEEIIAIQKPAFFQVSLEGLPQHNDGIRGTGHFERIVAFLSLLRSLDVSTMVMLTLTSENMEQVIPLAELLRDKADAFHFNRLSLSGEGANLRLPDRKTYRAFLTRYLEAAENNPVMGIKDNLINILRHEQGAGLFGGCTGYGCGAAFNFVAVLADGEVHACRKFPSPIGNIHDQGLAEIYDSAGAQRFRLGPGECRGCSLRPACGGCLASVHSHGLNVFEKKDPFCFLEAPAR